jgi:hypothetical protein
MGEKGLMEEDWNDRNNCRKKIIQGLYSFTVHLLTIVTKSD